MSRDEMVAALERLIDDSTDAMDWPSRDYQVADAALLRALADSLRKAENAWRLEGQTIGYCQMGAAEPVWIIPEPRIARRALSGEGE